MNENNSKAAFKGNEIVEIYYYPEDHIISAWQQAYTLPDNERISADMLVKKTNGNKQLVWYWDSNKSQPVEVDQLIREHYTEYLNGKTIVLTFYGRWEKIPVKVLDIEGVKTLYDILSLKDYPNNEVLMAVIDAIDAEKLDKNKLFVGTQEEYDTASQEGTISEGAIVILTDVN